MNIAVIPPAAQAQTQAANPAPTMPVDDFAAALAEASSKPASDPLPARPLAMERSTMQESDGAACTAPIPFETGPGMPLGDAEQRLPVPAMRTTVTELPAKQPMIIPGDAPVTEPPALPVMLVALAANNSPVTKQPARPASSERGAADGPEKADTNADPTAAPAGAPMMMPLSLSRPADTNTPPPSPGGEMPAKFRDVEIANGSPATPDSAIRAAVGHGQAGPAPPAPAPGAPAPQFSVPAPPATSPPVQAAEPVVSARHGAIGRGLGVEIARRVAEGGDAISVRLNPHDMGRIEVGISFDDSGMLRATLRAENPASLDLLRRDSADLGRALDQAGVRADAQSFRFENQAGDSGRPPRREHQPPSAVAGAPSPATDASDLSYRPLRVPGRLDVLA